MRKTLVALFMAFGCMATMTARTTSTEQCCGDSTRNDKECQARRPGMRPDRPHQMRIDPGARFDMRMRERPEMRMVPMSPAMRGIELSDEQKAKLKELNKGVSERTDSAMRQLRQEGMDAADQNLKTVLTAEQYSQYLKNKEEMELNATKGKCGSRPECGEAPAGGCGEGAPKCGEAPEGCPEFGPEDGGMMPGCPCCAPKGDAPKDGPACSDMPRDMKNAPCCKDKKDKKQSKDACCKDKKDKKSKADKKKAKADKKKADKKAKSAKS